MAWPLDFSKPRDFGPVAGELLHDCFAMTAQLTQSAQPPNARFDLVGNNNSCATSFQRHVCRDRPVPLRLSPLTKGFAISSSYLYSGKHAETCSHTLCKPL